MRKRRNSLERGLVSSSSSGLWSQGYAARPPSEALFRNSLEALDEPKDGCLSRIPYSSLMAFMMCFIGVVLFTVMTVWSFNATVEQARRVFNISDIPWLDKIHILFFVVAFAMIVVTFALLGVGILSTGSTRHELYRRQSARHGGRLLCIVAIALASLLNILWVLLVALTGIFSFIYFVFSLICASLPAYSEETCIDFSVFRPLVKEFSDANLVLCSGNAQQFCALTDTVAVWYGLSCFSSFLICLGLLLFIASAAANYAHIGGEQKNQELREILITETTPDSYHPDSNNQNKSGNTYASGPPCRKSSSSKLMDFQVDAYPQSHQLPYSATAMNGGTIRKTQQQSFVPNFHPSAAHPVAHSPAFFRSAQQQQFASNRPPKLFGGGEFFASNSKLQTQPLAMKRVPYTTSGTVGGAINAARRNSYHNSLKDEYNAFMY